MILMNQTNELLTLIIIDELHLQTENKYQEETIKIDITRKCNEVVAETTAESTLDNRCIS